MSLMKQVVFKWQIKIEIYLQLYRCGDGGDGPGGEKP